MSIFAKLLYRLFAPRKKTKDETLAIIQERQAQYQAQHGGDPLNPNSIVDVMKALGLDSSIEARRDLWNEFRLSGEFEGTAPQNDRLMEELLEQVALGDFAK